jgi:hypothetical protein
VIDHPAHSIRPAAKRFVAEWLGLLTSGSVLDGALTPAARLVQDRERRLKTSQSRFANRSTQSFAVYSQSPHPIT